MIITFSVTGSEAMTLMLACKLAARLLPPESREKYEDAYQVLLSQYAGQTAQGHSDVNQIIEEKTQ